MRKNNGFTLIELLAVIVILGILLSVTTIAVNNIKKKQDRKNYENVISSILTGAKQYVTDTNYSSSTIDVNTLYDEGYVDFDQTEYSEFLSKTVNVVNCTDFIKRKFKITAKGDNGSFKEYNDCGCEMQQGGKASSTLCSE